MQKFFLNFFLSCISSLVWETLSFTCYVSLPIKNTPIAGRILLPTRYTPNLAAAISSSGRGGEMGWSTQAWTRACSTRFLVVFHFSCKLIKKYNRWVPDRTSLSEPCNFLPTFYLDSSTRIHLTCSCILDNLWILVKWVVCVRWSISWPGLGRGSWSTNMRA